MAEIPIPNFVYGLVDEFCHGAFSGLVGSIVLDQNVMFGFAVGLDN